VSEGDLVERLAALSTLAEVPREELEWLVAHGHLEVRAPGEMFGRKGQLLEYLWIVLAGHVPIRVDRGSGPRVVVDWGVGDVTGVLPYSRATAFRSDNFMEEETELLSLHLAHFPEMIRRCPVFTTHTVHVMLDRARSFNASDLHEEKMLSLGKLAAGLAHELNNPASAAVRSARLLQSGLEVADAAVLALGAAGLTPEQLRSLRRVRDVCVQTSAPVGRPPMEQADREDEIASWLEGHGCDPAWADALADTALDVPALDALAQELSGDVLDAALGWVASACGTRVLAVGIQLATTRIFELVDAVKRFTYMDNLAGAEEVDVEAGLRDTLAVMSAKVADKAAVVTLDVEPGLPRVHAAGGDLNQVWLHLIDNALDALTLGGRVDISGRRESDGVVVRVVDDGPGIDPAVLPRVFDPFVTTKEPGRGMGLGLAITRRLLSRHRGEVSVESRPGRTEFRITLEVSPAAATPTPPA
jgi:signal transduction histidine kinase